MFPGGGRRESGLQKRERLARRDLVADGRQRLARRREQASGLRRADLRERTGPRGDHRRHAHALDEPALRDRLRLRKDFPLLLLEEADALGRLRKFRVLRRVRVGEDFDRAQFDDGVGALRRHEERELPPARLGERERGEIDAGFGRLGLRMLQRGVALAQEELHRPFAARLESAQVRDVRDEGRRRAHGGRLVLGEDFVAVGPNGDLRRLLLVLVAAGWVVVGIRFAASGQQGRGQHGGQHHSGPRESGFHSSTKSESTLSGNYRQRIMAGHTMSVGAPESARDDGRKSGQRRSARAGGRRKVSRWRRWISVHRQFNRAGEHRRQQRLLPHDEGRREEECLALGEKLGFVVRRVVMVVRVAILMV